MAIRGGSWGIGGFKLPEFGITEALAKRFSGGQTTDLSRAIAPKPKAQAPAPKPQNYTPAPLNYTPDSYSPVGGYAFNQPPATTPPPVSTGGTSGGGGQTAQQSSGQSSGQDYSGVMQSVPEQPQIDFDALIAPAIQGLEAAIGPLQQGTEGTVQGLQTNLANQKAATQANISGQTATLGQARTTQQTAGENAVNEARRQMAEIQQGLQSRYGGSTGTGAFAGELVGRQTQANIGKVRQQVSAAMLEIDNKLVQVQEIGRIAVQDLEDKTADQIRQAKNQLDMQLADIRRQKGEIQANKAAMAANAIQIYQTTVNNVNAQNAQFKQNLALQQAAAEQNLRLAQEQAKGIVGSYQGTNFNTSMTTPVAGQTTQETTETGGQLNPFDYLLKRNKQMGIYSGTTK